MFISSIIGRILQAIEFLRYNVGSYFVALWQSSFIAKIVIVVTFIWGCIRTMIAIFARLCNTIASLFSDMGFHGIQAGGVDILSFANTVLPLDEMIALLVTWFTVYGVCASIRFVRAAWAAIPLKAT